MKKVALFVMMLVVAWATNVTFQVDMSQVDAVSGDGVHVAGDFQGWDPAATELLDGDGDLVYAVTLDITAGEYYEFKYINGNAWGSDEGTQRNITVPAEDTVLDVVCFNMWTECPSDQVPVNITFQVDMNFENVSADGVHVAGAFQGWDPAATELLDDDGDGIYAVTLELMSGDHHEYKFVNGNAWGSDESVSGDCAAGDWGNRYIDVPTEDTVLPAYCYGTCEMCATTVTFAVNMAYVIQLGAFNPETDTVGAIGNFTGWGYDEDLTDDDGNMIYEATINFTELYPEYVGGTIEYKYRANDSWDVCESDIANRLYDVVAGQNVIPTVWWNDVEMPDQAYDTEVLFLCDMSVQLATGNFDPATDLLVVRGGTVPLSWGGTDFQFLPNPMNEELYQVLVQFDQLGAGVENQYKYVIVHDGVTDEWESGDNRTFMISGAEEDTDGNGYIEVVTGEGWFFNNMTADDIFMQDVTVVFSIDAYPAYAALNDGICLIDIQTGADSICAWGEVTGCAVTGAFSGWTWGNMGDDNWLVDDGTGYDAVAGDNVFTGAWLFSAGDNKNLEYKFGLNGYDNCSGFAENYYVTADDAEAVYYVETACWGSMNTDPRLPFGDVDWGVDYPNVPYACMECSIGDVDANGVVNVLDVIQAVNIALGITTPTDLQFCAADYNGDSSINVLDVIGIVNLALGGKISFSSAEAALIGNTLTVSGDVAGIQANGIISSAIVGDDILAEFEGMTIVYNLNGHLETSSFVFENAPENVIVGSTFGDEVEVVIPTESALSQNYPNPFNPSTSIVYSITEDGFVSLSVYNLVGQKVANLVNTDLNAGTYSVQWDGRSENGEMVSNGVYFYRMNAGNFTDTKKMVLLK